MSGAEKLRERILFEANSQAEVVLAEAQQKAAAILAHGQETAAAKKAAVLEDATKQAQERLRRAQTIAELDARKAILSAKENCIEETFEKSIARLQALEPLAYKELLYTMIVAASQTGTEAIIVSQADRVLFTDELLLRINQALLQQGKLGKLTLATESREMQGGFVLREDDVEINSSFNSLLRMQRDQLEPDVAAILFIS
ncbi:MAG: V-type proton ATPase subunit E [Firmicutes bacterium]|nr:V-type proton ATPase subunit E [Bacillota bacterium]